MKMAESSSWLAEIEKDSEEKSPVPPYSRCTAIRDFVGQQPQDLSFRCAENSEGKRGVMPVNFVKLHTNPKRLQTSGRLKTKIPTPFQVQDQYTKSQPHIELTTVLSNASPPPLPPKPTKVCPEPETSSVKTLLRTAHHERIVNHPPAFRSKSRESDRKFIASSPKDICEAPIDIDSRPPAPLPPEARQNKETVSTTCGLYKTQSEFIEKSGWFTPSLESVLCKKANFNWSSLTATTSALYLFLHKSDERKRYIGKSRNCYHELIQMFHRLFEKPETKLSPIELEFKYFNPDADNWHFRLYPVPVPDNLEAELGYKIVHHSTLQPNGLNTEIKFTSKEQFYVFAESYVKLMKERPIKEKKKEYS